MVYRANKQLKEYLYNLNGLPNGDYKTFNDSGLLESEAGYVNGKISGTKKYYYKYGALKKIESYWDGKIDGSVKTYYETENFKKKNIMFAAI